MSIIDNNESSVEKIATVRKPRGFAAMDREKVRELAAKGGKSAHAMGVAHQFTSDEAREAGKKGGIAPHKSRGRISSKTRGGDGVIDKEQSGGLIEKETKAA